MFYIANKFGFVSELYNGEDIHGDPAIKAKHCIDVREAMPFKTRAEAENKYRRTYLSTWWFCVLSSTD